MHLFRLCGRWHIFLMYYTKVLTKNLKCVVLISLRSGFKVSAYFGGPYFRVMFSVMFSL